MIVIKNEFITAKFNEIGAELKSLKCDDYEYIWGGREDSWNRSCPILFPICGGLNDDKYVFCGKEYTLSKHGFLRDKSFEIEQITDDSVIFLSKSDADTKRRFPFDYELRVVYKLIGKSLKNRLLR